MPHLLSGIFSDKSLVAEMADAQCVYPASPSPPATHGTPAWVCVCQEVSPNLMGLDDGGERQLAVSVCSESASSSGLDGGGV